jgi:hypothetical protein
METERTLCSQYSGKRVISVYHRDSRPCFPILLVLGVGYRFIFIQVQKILIYVTNKYVFCVAASVDCSEYTMDWL